MVLVPLSGFAAERKGSYFLVKPGAYFPTGDLQDSGFDTAFTGELAIGTYYNPNLAFEGGVGYFRSSASGGSAGSSVDSHIWVIPVTATLKGVLPFRGGEVTVGGGMGVYFATMETKVSGPSVNFSEEDSGAVFGGHALVGVSVDISPSMFIGAEGKYIVTTKATFLDTKTNLNGFMVTGVLGYRF
jgi:opacity protein-like surface antigen